VIAVVFVGNSFSQSWYSGSGYIYNNGGNVRVSGNRYTQTGDSAALSFGDQYGQVASKWGLGLYFSVYGYSNLLTLNQTGNIGVATTSPNSKFEVNGSIAVKTVVVSSNYTAGDVSFISVAGAFQVTVPAASSCGGRIYTIKNTYSGTATVVAADNGNFDTYNNIKTLHLNTNETYQIIAVSGGWQVISKFVPPSTY
jgi:hypothetical protein